MFVSRHAHDLIVAELRNQITELKAERDFYRREFTRKRGAEFSVPAPQQPPLFPSAVESSPVRSPADKPVPLDLTAPLDAGWSVDDRELFALWCRGGNVANGEDPLEVWQKRYGQQSPLMALTV